MDSDILLGLLILAIGLIGGWYLRRKYKAWDADMNKSFETTARFFDGR
jgi:uncharacterized protein YneF (UPF0154 family)